MNNALYLATSRGDEPDTSIHTREIHPQTPWIDQSLYNSKSSHTIFRNQWIMLNCRSPKTICVLPSPIQLFFSFGIAILKIMGITHRMLFPHRSRIQTSKNPRQLKTFPGDGNGNTETQNLGPLNLRLSQRKIWYVMLTELLEN